MGDVKRPFEVTIVAVFVLALPILLLYTLLAGMMFGDYYFTAIGLIWVIIWHILLAYGLFRLLLWSRWATLLELAFLTGVNAVLNTVSGIDTYITIFEVSIFFLIFLLLSSRRSRQAFRDAAAAEGDPAADRTTGVTLAGIALIVFGGLATAGSISYFLPLVPGLLDESQRYNPAGAIFSLVIIPSWIQLVAGIGIYRMEFWIERSGRLLTAIIVPYLILILLLLLTANLSSLLFIFPLIGAGVLLYRYLDNVVVC